MGALLATPTMCLVAPNYLYLSARNRLYLWFLVFTSGVDNTYLDKFTYIGAMRKDNEPNTHQSIRRGKKRERSCGGKQSSELKYKCTGEYGRRLDRTKG